MKSCAKGNYLRIYSFGTKIDVFGGSTMHSYFRRQVVQGSPNIVKLASNQHPDSYIAMSQDGKVSVGKGGPNCNLTFFRQNMQSIQQQHQYHPSDDILYKIHQPVQAFVKPLVIQPVEQVAIQSPVLQNNININNNINNNNNGVFNAVYQFKMNNRVVIQGPHGKHLRVSPTNFGFADGAGAQGSFARWDVIIQQKGVVTLSYYCQLYLYIIFCFLKLI